MSASQNNLSLVINQQDASGVNILNRIIGALAYSGAVGQFTDGLLIGTTGVAQTLPKAVILQYALYNTSAAANISVAWTPESATGSVVGSKVAPGSLLLLWQVSSGASGGVTAVTLTSDIASGTYQQFMGG